MFFPDRRERVGVPDIQDRDREALKRRAYKPAFVDNEARPEFSFAFYRPPGWEVGPPKMPANPDVPFASLAHLSRHNPAIAVELKVVELQFDALPGDFLDAAFACADLPRYAAGPLGAGWYADRSGPLEGGEQTTAAHRIGQNLFVFLAAARGSAAAKLQELHTILGTFSLKEAPGRFFVDDYAPHGLDGPAAYEVPTAAKTTASGGGVVTKWAIDGGTVELSCKTVSARQVDANTLYTTAGRDVAKGQLDPGTAVAGDLPAADGGVFVGPVVFRVVQTKERDREVALLVGQNAAGQHVRLMGVYPARTAHSHAWCRGRFVVDHALRTMLPATTS